MKKFLIIGLIFILAGGLFCGAAYAVGEKNADSLLGAFDTSFPAAEIKKIEIGEHLAEINFANSKSDAKTITVNAKNISESDFECRLVGDDTLYISYDPPPNKRFGFISLPVFHFSNRVFPVITVYIPKDLDFESVRFGGGVGEVNIDELTVADFTIGGGLGNYCINKLTVNKNGGFKIEDGVGEIEISNAEIYGETVIMGGLGNIFISGKIEGDINMNTGVGNVDLNLFGNASDYNITAKRGVGEVKLNGKNIGNEIYTGGKYHIDIEAGLGNINIEIK